MKFRIVLEEVSMTAIEVYAETNHLENGQYTFTDEVRTYKGSIRQGKIDGFWSYYILDFLDSIFSYREGLAHGYSVLYGLHQEEVQVHWHWKGKFLGLDKAGEALFYKRKR
jgi:hypothetical protein